jgi:predicted SAM-dependent methyltransferase
MSNDYETHQRLNLGCGHRYVKNWINVDYSIGARVSKIYLLSSILQKLKILKTPWNKNIILQDLTKKFQWGTETIHTIYSSHTLEHLSKEQGELFLYECHRVLRKGGVLRIIVPNLDEIVDSYNSNALTSVDFLEALGVLDLHSKNKLMNIITKHFSYPHRCMYNSVDLSKLLRGIGFEVKSKKVFESQIQDIKSIELLERCSSNEVILEAYK